MAEPRGANWTTDEKNLLCELYNSRKDVLEGKFKGCERGKEKKRDCWQDIVNILNARSSNKQRKIEEVKKQHQNIKYRAKNIHDALKRPPTGGGPRCRSPDQSEAILLQGMEGSAQLEGLSFGYDTEDVQPTESQVVPSSISDTHVHEPPAEPQPSTSSELNCIVLQDGILKTSLTPGPCLSSNSSKKRKLLDEEQETLRAERLKYVAETEMLKAQTNYYEMKTALVKAQLHRLEQ